MAVIKIVKIGENHNLIYFFLNLGYLAIYGIHKKKILSYWWMSMFSIC